MNKDWKKHSAENFPLPPHTHQWEEKEYTPSTQEYLCSCGASQTIEYDGTNKLTIIAELMSKEEQESYKRAMRGPSRMHTYAQEIQALGIAQEGHFVAQPQFHPEGPFAFPDIPGR